MDPANGVVETVDFEAIVQRPALWVRALLRVALTLATMLVLTGGAALLAVGSPLYLLAFIGTVAMAVGSRGIATRRGGVGRAQLESDAVRLQWQKGERVVERASLIGGYERTNESLVVFQLEAGGEVVVRTSDDGGGKRLLDHLGLSAPKKTVSFPLRRMLGSFTTGLLGSLVATIAIAALTAITRAPVGFAFSALIIAPLFGIAMAWRFGQPRVVVGADGIRTHGNLINRFIGHADIARVAPSRMIDGSLALEIVTKHGSSLMLPAANEHPGYVRSIAAHIEASRELSNAAANGAALDLARGAQTFDAWRDRLRRLATAPPGYRDQALGAHDFERVLGDPTAGLDARVGAALALRAVKSETSREHIRIAADTTADEPLHRALAAAAEDDPDLDVIERATRR